MCTFLLVAWLFGCEKQSPDAPPVAPPPGPGGGNRAHECASADDCALSNLESASDCCGDPCNSGFAYSKGELATLEAARTAVCARKDVECPVADCNFPTNFINVCGVITGRSPNNSVRLSSTMLSIGRWLSSAISCVDT